MRRGGRGSNCSSVGCAGGKLLVEQSYADAKVKVAEEKTRREREKAVG